MMNGPALRIQKNCDKTTHKMIIPQKVVDKWGTQFIMEIYDDHIKLIPLCNNKED